MYNNRFKKAARVNRTKAVFFTIAFHLALLGAIAYSTGTDISAYIPDAVLELMGVESEQEPVANSTGA